MRKEIIFPLVALLLIPSLTLASSEPEVETYLIDNLGSAYFNTHFSYQETKIRGRMDCIVYEFTYGSDSTEMTVCYDTAEGKIAEQMSSVLTHPQSISFSKSSATSKAAELGLPSPKEAALIFYAPANSLAWKVLWDHTPTMQEKLDNGVEGYLISADDGSTLKTYNFQVSMGPEPALEPPAQKPSFLSRLISFLKFLLHL